jgi:hypothetical protein
MSSSLASSIRNIADNVVRKVVYYYPSVSQVLLPLNNNLGTKIREAQRLYATLPANLQEQLAAVVKENTKDFNTSWEYERAIMEIDNAILEAKRQNSPVETISVGEKELPTYNLQGTPVSFTQKGGVYIRGGKKFYVK